MKLLKIEALNATVFKNPFEISFLTSQQVEKDDPGALHNVCANAYLKPVSAFVGNNGSGKSLSLKLIALVLDLLSGKSINNLFYSELIKDKLKLTVYFSNRQANEIVKYDLLNSMGMHEYDELITDTPQGLIDLLFNDGTMDDFLSFETLYDAFMSDRFKFPENRERILIGYVMSLQNALRVSMSHLQLGHREKPDYSYDFYQSENGYLMTRMRDSKAIVICDKMKDLITDFVALGMIAGGLK